MKRNIKKIVTLVLALVVIMGCFVQSADAATYSLDLTSVIPQQELYEEVTLGQFTIMATSEKFVQVANVEKVAADGTAITQALRLCGTAGGGMYRRVDFTITEKTTFKVYTASNSESEDRALGVYDITGASVPIATVVAPAKTKPVAVWELELEPGSYYFASPSSGVNIYGIIATTPDPEPTAAPTTVPTAAPTAAPTVAPTTAPTVAPTQTPDIPKDGESSMIYVSMLVCAVALGCVYFAKRRRA